MRGFGPHLPKAENIFFIVLRQNQGSTKRYCLDFFIGANPNLSTERKFSVIMKVEILFLLKVVDEMAEIIKVYRQLIPTMRFIGKSYGNV